MNDEQINDLIAEKVMGWEKLWGGWHDGKNLTEYVFAQDDVTGYADVGILYNPLHNIAQAIEAFQVAVTKKLIHHLYSLNEIIFCYDERRGNWLVQRIDCQDYSDTLLGYNQSLATAICLALVAAVEAK